MTSEVHQTSSTQHPASSKQNIFLIGMMGSWKSTVGKKLAIALDLKFVDTDDEIEEATAQTVADIFDERGEAQFREMETAYFVEKSLQSGYIISTGGGIVVTEANRNALKNNGITIFLKASPETLSHRIKNTDKRPLLHGEDSLMKLSKIWKNRKDFYEASAHITIETDRLNPMQVLEIIIKKLETHNAIH
ncbi:MAG: shikimate kinase [Candidatus Marinimicrobia bacterium]|nr:shikimate kinase [Candidatus Neomarinimicrobiota bacterium]